MTDMSIAIWGLVVALGANAVAWFFRSPKESIRELESRLAVVEARQNQLAADYAGVHGRHDEALKSLTAAVTRLTDRFDQYMGTVNGHTRGR